LELGHLIRSDLSLAHLLYQLAQKAAELIKADRCSIYLYDPIQDELWTTVALGLEDQPIRIPAGEGIAGHCFQQATTINLKDAYEAPFFYAEVDAKTGYKTRSLLCEPIFNRDRQVLGVIQLLNKIEGLFTEEDEIFLRTYANHAAIFLEIAQLQKARIEALEHSREELRRLNRVKDKALDHLSHELKTPLAIIRGNLKMMVRKLQNISPPLIKPEVFQTIEKHLNRLVLIQEETNHIIRSSEERGIGRLLDELRGIWQKIHSRGTIPPEIQKQWESILGWMETGFAFKPLKMERIDIWNIAQKVLTKVQERASARELSFSLEGEPSLFVSSNAKVLEETLEGLLKNAVENTPDEGRIRLILEREGSTPLLRVQDGGVGISPEDQKYLFDGLYHIQATELYSSKKPFEFNAGGKGLDLLKARMAGRRYAFDLSVESRRCLFMKNELDECPGRISHCPQGRTIEGCLNSGGSIFTITFGIK
jgi:signal transduction histidine kinase